MKVTAMKFRKRMLPQINATEKYYGSLMTRLVGPPSKGDKGISPLTKALLAGGGVIKRKVLTVPMVMAGTNTKWWAKPYPKYWKFIWFWSGEAKAMKPFGREGTGLTRAIKKYSHTSKSGHIWTKMRRPKGRLKKNIAVKGVKPIGDPLTERAVIVYTRFSKVTKKKSPWDERNAWYARFLENGTPSLTNSKGNRRPRKPTKATHFWSRSVAASEKEALDKVMEKIKEYFDTYPAQVTMRKT